MSGEFIFASFKLFLLHVFRVGHGRPAAARGHLPGHGRSRRGHDLGVGRGTPLPPYDTLHRENLVAGIVHEGLPPVVLKLQAGVIQFRGFFREWRGRQVGVVGAGVRGRAAETEVRGRAEAGCD